MASPDLQQRAALEALIRLGAPVDLEPISVRMSNDYPKPYRILVGGIPVGIVSESDRMPMARIFWSGPVHGLEETFVPHFKTGRDEAALKLVILEHLAKRLRITQ